MKYQGYRFGFGLSPHLLAIRLVNSDEIEFRSEERDGEKFLTGFSILVRNMKKGPALFHVIQKAGF